MVTQSYDDFAALSKRYWQAWTDGLSGGGAAFDTAAKNPWRQAMDAWVDSGWMSQRDVDAAMGQFTRLSGDWMGRMQELAGQFAGKQASAGDIAQAWKAMLGQGTAPWQAMLQAMPGADWMKYAENAWSQFQAYSPRALLDLPTVGFSREHQERFQQLAQAQLQLQERMAAWQAMLNQSVQDAVGRFEQKLGERAAPGKQIDSVRALFDLWVDAAEEAYATMALSREYRSVYAALVNAQMRVRADAQAIQEQITTAMGMPGRTELDSAHRKLAELEREVRRLRRAAPAPSRSADAEERSAAKASTRKPVRAATASPKARKATTKAGNAATGTQATPAKAERSAKAARAVAPAPVAKATSKKTKTQSASAAKPAAVGKGARRMALPDIRTPGMAAMTGKGSKR